MTDEIEEAETPLIDQMRQIPIDARLVYEFADKKQTLFAPVGLMFKRAVDEIEELRAQIEMLEDSMGANAGVKS